MKVIVVGAGIGGLGAAIALNRAGHDVEVYETSSFLNEVGAAVHMAPNASRVLKSWGLDFEKMYPVECEAMKSYSVDLQPNQAPTGDKYTWKEGQEKMGFSPSDPWLMVHRVDLHHALRVHAESGFQGRFVKIHLKSKVESVNAETGEVHFFDGRTVQGDLVIGADGIHSRSVHAVQSTGNDEIVTGQKIFRFLVPTEKAEKNPLVKKFIDTIGLNGTSSIGKPGKRLVVYPCRSGTLLNCGLFHPTTEADDHAIGEASWHNPGSVEDMMKCVAEFDEGIREFCSLAEDVKDWTLVTRDPPLTYVKGKLALLGDAAHPMLPHQGQGGAQALEDAGALGALFASDTAPEEVSELLEIYNKVRYDHTVMICIFSRVPLDRREDVLGELQRFVPGAKIADNAPYLTWNSFPAREVERLLALRRSEKAL